ncbi:MAG: FMN-binding negative transcriptional regulator [Proteobacteria bacterium]|nr:MAG: FMN-binding negative transcriptional regulator [Pseudomonadota bacterium]
MVYKQASFNAPDRFQIIDLIRKHAFAILITHHNGTTEVTHLPFTYEEGEGDDGTLYVHLAKANPHWKAIDAAEECLVVFNGPQSYISPRWYPADSQDHIPTWNYAVVHARGKAERIDDPERVFWQMDQIHRAHDSGPLLSVTEDEKASMIPHVVLFKIPISELQSVFKLNQNRSVEDAEGAIRGLAATRNSVKMELSELMRDSLAKRKKDLGSKQGRG